jgi:putative membrane protein
MSTVGTVLVVLVALLHTYFLVLEMFLWETPFGRRISALRCVIVAGAYGAVTVSLRILVVQALPAILALVAVWTA